MREKIAVALGLLMAVGAWIMFQRLGPPPQPTEQILVAAHDLVAYRSIESSDIRWKTVPLAALDPGWVTSPDAVLGRIATMPLLEGEPIHRDKLADPEQALSPGYRAVAIQTNLIAAAGGHIQPGDVVDVYYVPTNGRSPGGALVTGVTVLDVRTSDNRPYRANTGQRRAVAVTVAGEQVAAGAESTPGLVVLKLSPDVIPAVLQSSENGIITLARRVPGDESYTLSVLTDPTNDEQPVDADEEESLDVGGGSDRP